MMVVADYGVEIAIIPAPMDLWDKVCNATEPKELKIYSPIIQLYCHLEGTLMWQQRPHY